MTYRPLPPCLTIRQSEIDGLGLFATEDIAAGFEIGVTHWLFGDRIIRTPLGGFYNSDSNEPNCEKISDRCNFNQFDIFVLRTLRPISAGEEITVKYTLPEYEGDDWKARNREKLHGEYRELEESIKVREEFEAREPRCSDHAVIRYLERHMDITFEEVRERLLTKDVVAAMNMGAQSVRHSSGVRLILKDKCIVTVVED